LKKIKIKKKTPQNTTQGNEDWRRMSCPKKLAQSLSIQAYQLIRLICPLA
jgi:hypothetical protein